MQRRAISNHYEAVSQSFCKDLLVVSYLIQTHQVKPGQNKGFEMRPSGDRSSLLQSCRCWNVFKIIAFDAPIHFCIAALTAKVLWLDVITGRFKRMTDSCFCTMSRSLCADFKLLGEYWPVARSKSSSSRDEGSMKSCTSFHHRDISASMWATSSGSVTRWLIDLCRSSRMRPLIRLLRARNDGRRKCWRSIPVLRAN